MKKNILAISLVTMSCLYGILAAVIILICIFTEIPVVYGIGVSIIILIIQFLIAPSVNDFIFRHFYKMQFDESLPEYLETFIKESCEKHNMQYPRIGFIDDGSPNAFTYGRTKNDARVVITRGILDLLTEDEVKAVVAHELGHANHYDMLFMTVAQVVPLILYYVSQILLRTKSRRSSNSNNKVPITFSYNSYENTTKYINELKNNFKIIDELLNIPQLESFERDLDTKIKSFQLMKKNFESSPKFIDKLRMYLRWEEVSPEKIILRNCEISSDRLYFLITKKYFDFGNIKHLNIANNNLGDIGGSYLMWLISKFSTKIDYLNISNNKIGRQTCEIIVDILQKNIIKIISLSIGGNKIGDKLFSEISIAISKNNFLNKLFINDNELGKISSFILGSILKYDKKLKLLDVSKNNFGDENIGYMLKGLICNTSLETLMINDMGLTNKSLRIFETTLCINSTLKKLFLERNKLNFKGWRLLSDILNKNKYIEYVSLVGNNFENEHINYIMDQQRQIKIRSISKTDYFLQITSGNEEVNLYEYLE